MIKKNDYSDKDINFLIDACRKNDRQAQFEIYNRYAKAMYNTSLRIVNNAYDAEDVMQESFLAAFKKINDHSGNVTFGAWLKKIVINKSIDYVRNTTKRINVLDKLDDQLEVEVNKQDENEDIEAEINQIKSGIQKLPEGYKIILNLYLIEGYDHEEISEILGITSSTSRSQFVRAKKKLIQLLKEKL